GAPRPIEVFPFLRCGGKAGHDDKGRSLVVFLPAGVESRGVHGRYSVAQVVRKLWTSILHEDFIPVTALRHFPIEDSRKKSPRKPVRQQSLGSSTRCV